MNKLHTPKKHMKTLGSMSRFSMVLASINESETQCDENRSNTGCNKPANHLPSSFYFILFFYFICHIYPLFTRKRIVSLYFVRDVRTRLGVAVCNVSEPPVFHIQVEASREVPCPSTKQTNLPACSPPPPLNAERQAGKMWILFF